MIVLVENTSSGRRVPVTRPVERRTIVDKDNKNSLTFEQKESQSPRSGAGILTQYHKEKEKSSNKTRAQHPSGIMPRRGMRVFICGRAYRIIAIRPNGKITLRPEEK